MSSTSPAKKPVRPAGSKKPPSRLAQWMTTERVIIGGCILLTVIILGVVAANSLNRTLIDSIQIDGLEYFGRPLPSHQETSVSYAQNPPVGGPHHPAWQQCGVYTEPITDEHGVHSLEHGAVWITYSPDLPGDQVQKLADITRSSTHRLLSPYPGIDSPIILSAWGYQLRVDNADDSRVLQFIQKYEQGPQTPELGAVCSGGITTTTGLVAG